MAYPPCFESEADYLDWRARLRDTAPEAITSRSVICWDCTPQHKQEMLSEGRCLHPNTRFVQVIPLDEVHDLDPEPSLQGVSPVRARQLRAEGRLAGG